ncbi:MAG: DUF4339 domain-containing protein [Akkermansiaceae bacterium]|nr:DUF4339 domain-containing protein [Verrucomicrobiales bacterium]
MTPLNQTGELMYSVRGADGKEYGPVPLEQINAWSRDGRVQPQTELRRTDMEYWARAADFTELQTLFPTAPAAAFPAGTTMVESADPVATAQMKSGASWFYWIAGLSLVNSIAAFSGSDWRFIVGLGITQIFDALAGEFGGAGRVIVLLLDLLAAGTFILLGVFAHKRKTWAFIVGMILFGLDTVFFLIIQEWIGVAFHVFVLYCLFRGFKGCRELNA